MNKSTLACALSMALSLGSLSANGQGRVRDPNASNPEIYQIQPAERSGRNFQGVPIPRGERSELERRESERRDLAQREAERREAVRREHGRYGVDRRGQIEHGYDWRNHHRQEQALREHERRNGQWRDDSRDHDRQSHQWRDGRHAERHYYGARGPEFRRGGSIPYEYRARQYWVNDWHGHGLSAPPYGHHWVQVGPDYALIAIATGLIAYLIVNQ